MKGGGINQYILYQQAKFNWKDSCKYKNRSTPIYSGLFTPKKLVEALSASPHPM